MAQRFAKLLGRDHLSHKNCSRPSNMRNNKDPTTSGRTGPPSSDLHPPAWRSDPPRKDPPDSELGAHASCGRGGTPVASGGRGPGAAASLRSAHEDRRLLNLSHDVALLAVATDSRGSFLASVCRAQIAELPWHKRAFRHLLGLVDGFQSSLWHDGLLGFPLNKPNRDIFRNLPPCKSESPIEGQEQQ